MRKARIHSFAPIAGRDARVLILGSMPGKKSLQARQYYAHRQNAFWRIVCELLCIDPLSPYRVRIRALKSARIAVWDVLHSCTRAGSMDSGIDSGSEIANDFRAFFRMHAAVARVFFNGAKAEACFRRKVLPALGLSTLRYSRLPSTSPAHASMPYRRKRRAWRAILTASRSQRRSSRK